jgi:hypothetical protein
MSKFITAVTLAAALLQPVAQAGVATERIAVTSVISKVTLGRTVPVPPIPPTAVHNFFGYTVQVLPLDSAAGAGNGIIVGTANGVAVAYVNGHATPLPGKEGYTNIQPTSISPNGYIVGYADSANNTRGLFWSSMTNAPIDMGALGSITHPAAVNSQGVAVGAYYPTSVWDAPTAFAWSPSGGMHSIAPNLSNQSQAFDISESGYVAGFAWYGVLQTATRWYPGTFQAGTVAYSYFAWRAMENGTVFGQTVSWDLSDQATTIAPTPASYVYDISESGRKVGNNLFDVPRRGWTVDPGSNTLQILPVPTGAVDSYANKIVGCGGILGQVSYPDGTTRAVLWTKLTCDPLPVRND